MQAFVEAVIRRLRSCVDEDVFIPLYPKKLVSFFSHDTVFNHLKNNKTNFEFYHCLLP